MATIQPMRDAAHQIAKSVLRQASQRCCHMDVDDDGLVVSGICEDCVKDALEAAVLKGIEWRDVDLAVKLKDHLFFDSARWIADGSIDTTPPLGTKETKP